VTATARWGRALPLSYGEDRPMGQSRAFASVLWFAAILLAWIGGGCQRRAEYGKVGQYWARALQEVYKTPGELKAQDEREARKGTVYRKLIHGDRSVRAIALAFDDGPHPQYTPKLLAILQREQVQATFLVVGKMAEQYPDLIRQESAAGHLIGNHTYHHVNLTRIPLNLVETEWQACNEVIESILGLAMAYCRPPGGDYDADVITAAAKAGLTTVLWTDDPADYARPGDRLIERRVLDAISPGGIVLLHDGVQQTVDVLPQIIETLKQRGRQFQTIDEMARDTLGPPQRQQPASPAPLSHRGGVTRTP